MLNLEDKHICPFCGTEQRLKDYKIFFNDKGNKITYFKCNECGEKMKRNTLINDLTISEWGEWLYLSIRYYNHETYRFYDRVHFDKLIKNLKFYPKNVRQEFWDGYKEGKSIWDMKKGNIRLTEIENKMNGNIYKPKPTRLDTVLQPNGKGTED